MLGHPTDHDFLGMVRGSMISNCPVTANAVKNAPRIFGPDLAGIRGRTVRRPPESVTTEYVQIPRAVLEQHQLVMFVNGVPFLVSNSQIHTIPNSKEPSSRHHPDDGPLRLRFQVGTVLMDNKFEKL